ncbi:PWWP domain-containing protein 2A [Dendrobates tinctorius]|uniref:PWWP domain-containing protein 2A n=1 Tax=Dendrobates tinctorius TaxID=92724 RepID=UPI003CCA6ADF
MAAAAGAPGSGEGGEAEPDSEPISGDDRPRRDSTELHGGVVEEAGNEGTELRLPETEKQPECIGPHWESDVEGPPAALGSSALGIEEPMQMATDCNSPPAPCHGGAAAAAPEPVHLVCASSPHPQVTSGPVQCAPEPFSATPDPPQVVALQQSFPKTFPSMPDPPEDIDPLQMQVSAPLDAIHTPDPMCPTVGVADEQDPHSRMETDLAPDQFLQVQDPTLKPEGQITSIKDLSDELIVSEAAGLVISEMEMVISEVSEAVVSNPELVVPEAAGLVSKLELVESEAALSELEMVESKATLSKPEMVEFDAALSKLEMDKSKAAMAEPVMVKSEVAMAEPKVVESEAAVFDLKMDKSEAAMAEPETIEFTAALFEPAMAEPEMVEFEAALSEPKMAQSEAAMAEPQMVESEAPVFEPEVIKSESMLEPEMVDFQAAVSELDMVASEAVKAETALVEPKAAVFELEMVESKVCTVEEAIPEIADDEVVPKWVNVMPNSVPYNEDFDGDYESVPESFQERVQLEDVVENERVLDESGQCTEVELFLQPALVMKLDSPESHDVSLECQSDMSPEQESVQLIMSDSVPEDVHSPNEQTLEDAVSPMDSGISSELTSMEKELDSQSGHMETEPNVEINSASYSQDVDYDPFYRDTKTTMANSSNAEAYVQDEDDEVSTAPADIVQTKDLLEEPTLPSVRAVVDACMDNPDPRQEPPSAAEALVTGEINLIPGSEVQVTLDHIIQDAMVVSFRHGDRIFSGVLMDLSKRFGPHGIPVTLHPKREYKTKAEEPVQPQSTSFQEGESLKNGNCPVDVTPIASSEPCGVTNNNNNNLWTSKPPPLFHEGAPYPPPLFIRDTYNQSIPQPPPRKIKRLKKKIYREEPTSIMNAIKLRPRQVLCDKCKNVVPDKREVRKTTGNDSFKLEEGKRRRPESVTTVNKKLKTDHKVNGKSQNESQKKNPVPKVSNLGHGRSKVVKVASHTNAPKAQLHTKKVLQSKNMDHAKAREVLKMAKEKAQKKQKETSSSKNAHSKVHFTRRIQNTTSGTLPPRLRIKPQRYRNEENDASLKIGLESLRSSKIAIKPQTRYTATRSAGEAPSEIETPSNGPEEVSSAIQNQNASVCVPPAEQDEQQALSKGGSKSNITVFMTLNQTNADSSNASVCSSDSTDDMKSIHSECSSTENFDFPPGTMHAPPPYAPPPSSSSSSSSKEEKKLSNSLKIKMFSKNVSKCVTPDGRTICVGDIVWAKIYGFPWWPARILAITVSRKDNGLLVRQEASISWFGSPTTSFLALSQLSPFLENFQSRFNKKRKGLYRKAITEAAKAAKQLTPEVRALLTQFET